MNCPKCQKPLHRDGSLTYCPNCAYETPQSQQRPARAPQEEASPGFSITSAAQLGLACIERSKELVAEIARFEREISVRREEVARLTKVAVFCDVQIPASVGAVLTGTTDKPKRVLSPWRCPDCGFEAKGRAITAHKATHEAA